MKSNLNLFGVLVFAFSSGFGQQIPLKSTQFGYERIFQDVPAETLIGEIRFVDGVDDTVGVVRFDHFGSGIIPRPLIISSKLAAPIDSLGIHSFAMPNDSLQYFLDMIHNVNPQMEAPERDFVLVRVTYRYMSTTIKQYYVTNARITTHFLKMVYSKIAALGDQQALESFIEFIGPMNLVKAYRGRIIWKYQ